MTNEQINKRTEEVQEQIKHVKYLQRCERDPEFADAYKGLIDDLELLIINLPVPDEDYLEPTDAQILQNKADMAQREWRHNRGDDIEVAEFEKEDMEEQSATFN